MFTAEFRGRKGGGGREEERGGWEGAGFNWKHSSGE